MTRCEVPRRLRASGYKLRLRERLTPVVSRRCAPPREYFTGLRFGSIFVSRYRSLLP